MFHLNLVFLAVLAISTCQAGIPRYIQGRWIITDEDAQYEDTDRRVEEHIWSESPPGVVEVVTGEDQSSPSTPEPFVMKEQDSDEREESAVWKIVLVVAILLVSIVGSLSVAYYLCVWRGGRIYYQPQKDGYA